jgi:hypothetical protein
MRETGEIVGYPIGLDWTADDTEDNKKDFVTIEKVPGTRFHVVQLRRWSKTMDAYIVVRSSGRLDKKQAKVDVQKWAHYHGVEVR